MSFRFGINTPHSAGKTSRRPPPATIYYTSTINTFIDKDQLISYILTNPRYLSSAQIVLLRARNVFNLLIYQSNTIKSPGYYISKDVDVKFIEKENNNLV